MQPDQELSDLIFFKIFENEPRIIHFSTTRLGGVSRGEFKSLNLGNYSDDDPIKIYRNRAIVARKFNKTPEQLITPHQTHGSNVICIDEKFLEMSQQEKVEALYDNDAIITAERGVFVCVTTADCVPILLYDKEKHVVGAVHAGWRGTLARIVQKAISQMTLRYGTDPKDILVSLGPSISAPRFEVSNEVYKQFEKAYLLVDRITHYKSYKTGNIHLNLKELNKQQLIQWGVPSNQIEKSRFCTYTNAKTFFSARRQSIHSGRMMTGIMLK